MQIKKEKKIRLKFIVMSFCHSIILCCHSPSNFYKTFVLQELLFYNSFTVTVGVIICFLYGSDYFFGIADIFVNPAY